MKVAAILTIGERLDPDLLPRAIVLRRFIAKAFEASPEEFDKMLAAK